MGNQPGNEPFDMKEKTFDMMLQMMFAHGQENLTPGKELELINIIKTDLCEALNAFCPDLPAQISSQIASIVLKMQNDNDMLWTRDELTAFMKLYKINLDHLTGMLHTNQKEEGDIEEIKSKVDKVDDMQNIRVKMINYEGHYTQIYDKVNHIGIEKLNLNGLHTRIKSLLRHNNERVEWQKKPGEKDD